MEQLQLPKDWHDWRPGIDARAEISRLQAQGYGPTAIARSLNARQVPTPSGRGQWWVGTVRRMDPFNRQRWNAYMRRYRAGVRDGDRVR